MKKISLFFLAALLKAQSLYASNEAETVRQMQEDYKKIQTHASATYWVTGVIIFLIIVVIALIIVVKKFSAIDKSKGKQGKAGAQLASPVV